MNLKITLQGNLRITITVFFALILALTILYLIIDFGKQFNNFSAAEDQWYIKNFDQGRKKIFLVGSSHVAKLNTTHIKEFLNLKEKNYDLYNLATGADFIEKRILKLDKLISTQPELVVIGIRYQDFSDYRAASQKLIFNKIESVGKEEFFNHPEKYKEYLFEENILDQVFNNFRNPKFSTMELLSSLEKNKWNMLPPASPFPINTNTPFIRLWQNNDIEEINDIEGDEIYLGKNRKFVGKIDKNGVGVLSLKYIINQLKENSIEVIVFSTPHHPVFKKNMSITDQEDFENILEEISNEFNIDVYYFHDKYSDLEIWKNPDHIAKNPKGLIYSEDVAKIIIKELT